MEQFSYFILNMNFLLVLLAWTLQLKKKRSRYPHSFILVIVAFYEQS